MLIVARDRLLSPDSESELDPEPKVRETENRHQGASIMQSPRSTGGGDR